MAKALLIPLAAALATYYNQYNGGATDSGQIAKGISYVGGFYSAYLYASTPEYIVGHDLGKNLHMIGKIFTTIVAFDTGKSYKATGRLCYSRFIRGY